MKSSNPAISIVGSAITQFGELWQLSLMDLCGRVVRESLSDAQVEANQIEAVFVANKAAGNFAHQHHLNALVSNLFPHHPPAWRVEGACASGGLAILAAEHALLAGEFETVMVVGVEKMSDVSAAEATSILGSAADVTTEYGSTFPALYALLTTAYQQTYGLTREQLASVAVKNHQHALNNPHAQFRKAITIEQVMASPLVADPLRVLDCSPISDGAAAVILRRGASSSKKNSSKNNQLARRQVSIVGWGHGQDTVDLASRASLTSLAATQRAAHQAFARAGLKPSDIQVAELHDCFTIAEVMAAEDLGLLEPGQAGPATLAGQTTHGGSVVINPSGGLKACGHPVGATGVKQLAFVYQLLQAGQFATALTHNVGGSGATAVVQIVTGEKL